MDKDFKPIGNFNIDKIIVLFTYEPNLIELLNMTQERTVLPYNNFKLTVLNKSEIYDTNVIECELFNVSGVLGILRFYDNCERMVEFESTAESPYRMTFGQDGKRLSIINQLDLMAKDLKLRFKEISYITICFDSPINALLYIKEKLKNKFFPYIENDEEGIFYVTNSDTKIVKNLPLSKFDENSKLVFSDKYTGIPICKVYKSSIFPIRRQSYIAQWNGFNEDYWRLEISLFSSEIDKCMAQYQKDSMVKSLKIFDEDIFKRLAFTYIIDNCILSEFTEVNIVTAEKNEDEEREGITILYDVPKRREMKLNIDRLCATFSFPQSLYNNINATAVGDFVRFEDNSFQLKVTERGMVNSDEIYTVVDITTPDGRFGQFIFHNSGIVEFDADNNVFYTFGSRDIGNNIKYSMIGCLGYIIDILDLYLISIDEMQLCMDSKVNLMYKVIDRFLYEDLTGEKLCTEEEIVLGEWIQNKVQILTVSQEKFNSNNIISFTNPYNSMNSIRYFNSTCITDDSKRELIKSWNEFNNDFTRFEVTLDWPLLQAFIRQNPEYNENEIPLIYNLDNRDLKEKMLQFVLAEPSFDDNLTDFKIINVE